MASSEILDFDALLEPLDGDNPAGIDTFRSPESTGVFWRRPDLDYGVTERVVPETA